MAARIGGLALSVQRPWHAIRSYAAPSPINETFEVYPNRDSLPFMEDYRFEQAGQGGSLGVARGRP